VKKAIVIGSGFAGLSAASFLARDGWAVTVLEKHEGPGGRARQFEQDGFRFDMGPSWYWMPDVFDRYFAQFNKKREAYYSIKRLDPSYRVYWKEGELDVSAVYEKLKEQFETLEPGAGVKLDAFLKEAAYKYEVGINKLVHKPGLSLAEFMDWELARGIGKLSVFNSMKQHIARFFKHPKLRKLLEFPVLFLGALAEQVPALYSLMNYADIKLGTWYPQGGIYSVVDAMYRLATELGVSFRFGVNVTQINIQDGKATGVRGEAKDGELYFEADAIVGAADYHFIETKLLPGSLRSYSNTYWESKLMAPSCLIYYVGIDKKLPGIRHHSLFFDVDFDRHAGEIYDEPAWPAAPMFYVCAPSVSDSTVAPYGHENLFFLVPVAAGLEGDDEALRDRYFEQILQRFEDRVGHNVRDYIVLKRSYAVSDFKQDYNAFKGNAYGLANTLMQTAIFKPSMKSRKISNLYYAGQLTVPGPGVPPSLISGEIVAKQICKELSKSSLKKEFHDPLIS
jgi:phytoene desaturase